MEESLPHQAPLARNGLSLFIRVAAFVFVAMATTVSTLTGISYFAAQHIIRQQVEQRLLLAATQRAQAMQMYIRQQQERLSLITSRTRLRDHLRAWNGDPNTSDQLRDEMSRILLDAKESSEDILEIWVTAVTGKVIAATNKQRISADISADTGFLAGRQAAFHSEFYRDEERLLTNLTAPALDEQGNLLGVVHVAIHASRLIDIISNPVGLGRSGEALIGRREGRDQIHYLLPSQLTGRDFIEVEAASSMVKAIAGQKGFELADYDHQEVLIAYEPIPFQRGITPWGLVVKISVAEAYLPLANLRRIVLPLGLLLLIPAILSAYWLANRYARPIMELARSASILAEGNLKHRVPVTDDDEIGILSDAFNEMASQLESSYDALERRVAERTQELQRANSALERSNRDLEQFAYVTSHDLQEPLRAISGFTRMLNEQHASELSPEGREYLDFIVDGADRMKLLIDNLLEYSRVCSQGASLRRVDSREALQAALNNLHGTITDRRAIVTSEGLGDVLADTSQLTQLFQNLIGNAIKFCQDPPPRVDVRAEYRADEVIFSVSDNGIGIDPKDFDRIFTIFQRLHTREAYTGTGIGLAICEQIVQRHGGRIWVESNPSQGSTFCFTLHVPPRDA